MITKWTPEYRGGDILLATDLQAIVNPVNCVGIMGKGLALQFADCYPEIVDLYKLACQNKTLAPGKVQVLYVNYFDYPEAIVNFPTKRHWRDRSIYGDISNGLADMYRKLNELEISSVGIPPLGVGLGRLQWSGVRQMICLEALKHQHIHTVVFAPTRRRGKKADGRRP